MPRIPSSHPSYAPRCDPRLPEAALRYRLSQSPRLTTPKLLSGINVTAWLYRSKSGVEGVQVNPNITIAELVTRFGPAETPDAEVGIHSEARAAEWFRVRPQFQVLQIFSERIPCPMMCGPLLNAYFRGVPWYYYYDRRSWMGSSGSTIRRAADVLKTVYSL